MKLLIAGSIAALTLAVAVPVATPAAAQGIYVGPGGVSVGVGPRGYDRGYRGDRGMRRGDAYEGRSVYRERGRGYDDRY